MTDIYHIQISVYINAETLTGAKGGALIAKRALENILPAESLDEVVIDKVAAERVEIFGPQESTER